MTAPELLAHEMALVRRIDTDLLALGYIKGSDEYHAMFNDMIKFHRWFGWKVQPQGESK
jgi:hypothetical protein